MTRLFHRHRVRATFYHTAAIIFVATTVLWGLGIVSDTWSFYISATLFVADYIAEMYDPHPEFPGPWFKAHFHRFFDDTEDYTLTAREGWSVKYDKRICRLVDENLEANG